ncbi:MAG TPA: GntR family transcriptional regulator [Thermodesulfobacteriota bacterium]
MRPLVAKFYVIKRIIEARLEREYTPGDRLPSETDLCAEFDVSRITIQQALRVLERDGTIRREQGRGTFYIGAPRDRIETPPGGLVELMRGEGDALRVVDHRTVRATPRIAERLALAPEAPVVAIDRVAYLARAPIAFVVAYLPHALGLKVLDAQAELARTRIVALLSRRFGVAVASVHQTISAGLADPAFAPALGIEVGAPVLEAERRYLDADGRPVFFSQVFSRADRHRMVLALPPPR